MSTARFNQRTAAITLVEALVVIAILAVLAVVFLPALARPKRVPSRTTCVLNLRQIGISFRMWADDHDGKYPMQVSVTNGGAMEWVATGNVSVVFCEMSNFLDNPAYLVCPADAKRHLPDSFATLKNSDISYFVGLDASSNSPQLFLSGDDNLVVNGNRVQSGILNLRNSDKSAWTKERHQGAGNILMSDGSVKVTTNDDLNSIARLATNRLAIP